MKNVTELLREGKKKEIWKQYCGFLHYSMDEYMAMQKELLIEQLEKLNSCELGRTVMQGAKPASVEAFRKEIPFTTYRNYADFLLEKREDVLPEKPFYWVHTSGRSGEYEFKWIPYPKKLYELGGANAMSCMILASCKGPGKLNLKEGMSFLYTIAPPPYISGLFTESLIDQFNFSVYPPPERAKEMEFQERIMEAFKSALAEGLDFFYGVTSILLKISDQFSKGGGEMGKESKELLKNPKVLMRLFKALLKSKLSGRKLLPKDIWKVRGAVCGGMDTGLFKEKVEASWGIVPLEAYGSTEFGISATQAWNCESLNFFPNATFWEFMPEAEYQKWKDDESYFPRTHLMNEVEADTNYVLVGTNFHGGALVRYVLGDLIKVITTSDKKTGIELPQAVFEARIDDVIDIGGFTRLTEKRIWEAIENSGIEYTDWTVKKEHRGEEPLLNLYIEFQNSHENSAETAEKIHESLKNLDEPYRELEKITGLKPLRVTPLEKGTFRRYFEERQAAGADLAHLKPPHINPGEEVIKKILRMSNWKL
jgi:hypothetical protein